MPNLFAHAASLLLAHGRSRTAADAQSTRRGHRCCGSSTTRSATAVGGAEPSRHLPSRQAAEGGVAVFACFRTGRARCARPGLFRRPVRPRDRRSHARGRSGGWRVRRRSLAAGSVSELYRGGRRVSFAAADRGGCAEPHPPIRAPSSVRRRRDSSRRFRPTECAPRLNLSWYRARRLNDGSDVLLPADLCLRRPPAQQQIRPPFPLSTGSAAGTSWDAAALHGMLELIERDAASLWWRGGARGRSIPALDEAQVAARALLSQLRQDNPARRSWLLDVTTDIGVPSVVAVSCKADGFGVAFGLAGAADARGRGAFRDPGNVPDRTGL